MYLEKILKLFLSVLLIFFVAFVIFFFYASSGTIAKSEYAKLVNLPEISSPENDSVFTVVTYNIGYLSGMTNNLPIGREESLFVEGYKKTLGLWKEIDADIVGYQEIDYLADRSFKHNQSEEIAAACGFSARADAVNWDKKYVPFPYWPFSMHFGALLSGQSVHSRFPIRSHERIVLDRPADAPFYYTAFYIDRLLQICEIEIGGRQLTLMNVHLEAFDQKTRLLQAEAVRKKYEESATKGPVILLGDFNSTAPHPAYRQSKKYEDLIDNILKISNIKSAVAPDKFGDLSEGTYPSKLPKDKIDFIFYSPESLEVLEARALNEAGEASDHLPVFARFRFKN